MKKIIIRKNNKNAMKMHRREKEFIAFTKLRDFLFEAKCASKEVPWNKVLKFIGQISHKGNEMVIAYVLENQEQFYVSK